MSLKKCSKCEKDFDCCNETGGCWCESITLEEAILKHLKHEYEDCLCKDCLQEFEKVK
jgi:hypothetical protein